MDYSHLINYFDPLGCEVKLWNPTFFSPFSGPKHGFYVNILYHLKTIVLKNLNSQGAVCI